MAALTLVTGDLFVTSLAHVDGDDEAGGGACVQDEDDIRGVLMGSGALFPVGFPLEGDPDSLTLGSSAAALDSLGIDWALLSDSDFPVDYEDTWPPCGLPSDSFTVTRFNGNLTTPASPCGQGVLMVTGNFDAADGFQWDGIVLAGYIVPTVNDFRIDGLVVGGLDGNGTATAITDDTHIDYQRCYAFQAGKRLSHFQPVGSTWWEAM